MKIDIQIKHLLSRQNELHASMYNHTKELEGIFHKLAILQELQQQIDTDAAEIVQKRAAWKKGETPNAPAE